MVVFGVGRIVAADVSEARGQLPCVHLQSAIALFVEIKSGFAPGGNPDDLEH